MSGCRGFFHGLQPILFRSSRLSINRHLSSLQKTGNSLSLSRSRHAFLWCIVSMAVGGVMLRRRPKQSRSCFSLVSTMLPQSAIVVPATSSKRCFPRVKKTAQDIGPDLSKKSFTFYRVLSVKGLFVHPYTPFLCIGK